MSGTVVILLSLIYTAALTVSELLHRAERREMCDRILCRDGNDLRRLRAVKKPPKPSPYALNAGKWRQEEGDNR